MSAGRKFAATYWVHGSLNVDMDDNLEDLVDTLEGMEDNGDCSTQGYWELIDGEWQETDAGPIIEARYRAQQDRWRRAGDEQRATPYRVMISGPNGTSEWWSSHATQEEADAAAEAKRAEGWPASATRSG